MEQVTVITPSRGWQPLQLQALWEFRELAYFFAWREIKVRYKQTLLGASWAVIQPTATALIFALVFGRWGDLPSEGLPYILFAFAGLVAWAFFSQSLTQASRSVAAAASLVSRVYFPRLILPAASVLSLLVDLAIATAVLLVLMAFYGYAPDVSLLALPLFALLLVTTALGVTLILGPLNARYRDVQYVTPFLIQFWLIATPGVAYSTTLLPERWHTLVALNPMVSVAQGFRWSLFGTPLPIAGLVVSTAVAVGLLVGGAFYFRRMERTFADVL